MNLGTPEGVADYFASLRKVQLIKFEEQLGKSMQPQMPKVKKKKPIGFCLGGNDEQTRR